MEIVIKNKANEKIYVVKNCFPYQYRETTLGLPLRSRCKVGDIYNGLYVVDVKVLSGNVDFQKNKSRIIFSYSGVGNHADFFSRILDSVLKNFLGLMPS